MRVLPVGPSAVSATHKKNLRTTINHRSSKAVAEAGAVFIAVGTPSRRGDGHADPSYVFGATNRCHLGDADIRQAPARHGARADRDPEKLISLQTRLEAGCTFYRAFAQEVTSLGLPPCVRTDDWQVHLFEDRLGNGGPRKLLLHAMSPAPPHFLQVSARRRYG